MKSIYIFLLLALNLSCDSRKDRQQERIIETTTVSKEDSTLLAEVNAMPDVEPIRLHHYTESDVAKFTMATIMNQPPRIISVSKSAEKYFVTYNRPSDGQRFTYKVKIEGNRAIWASIDGRWRNTPDDERITYSEVGKKLKIMQTFSDGSSDEKLFNK